MQNNQVIFTSEFNDNLTAVYISTIQHIIRLKIKLHSHFDRAKSICEIQQQFLKKEKKMTKATKKHIYFDTKQLLFPIVNITLLLEELEDLNCGKGKAMKILKRANDIICSYP